MQGEIKSRHLASWPFVFVFDPITGAHYERFAGKGVDVAADARALPLRDGSVGAMFVSCLPAKDKQGDLRLAAMESAARVLRPSGLLIWKGAFYHDLVRADMAGLELSAVQIYQNDLEEIVFRKPELQFVDRFIADWWLWLRTFDDDFQIVVREDAEH